jgi:hypothetical protein
MVKFSTIPTAVVLDFGAERLYPAAGIRTKFSTPLYLDLDIYSCNSNNNFRSNLVLFYRYDLHPYRTSTGEGRQGGSFAPADYCNLVNF